MLPMVPGIGLYRAHRVSPEPPAPVWSAGSVLCRGSPQETVAIKLTLKLAASACSSLKPCVPICQVMAFNYKIFALAPISRGFRRKF